MQTLTPIKFDLIGASERTRNALAMAFNGRARGSCEFAVNGNADAVIVDLDGVGARAEWSRYRHQHPARPSVLLTLNECTVPETAIVLMKPIRIEALIGAVEDVRHRIETGELHAPGITLRAVPTGLQKNSPPAAALVARPAVASVAAASPTTMTPTRASSSQAKKAVTAAPALQAPVAGTAKATPARVEAPEPVKDYREVCGTAEDINCDDPEQVRRRCFDADSTLLDWLRRAVARSESTRSPVVLVIQDREMAVVSSLDRVARITVIEDILKHLCTKKYPVNLVALRNVTAEQLYPAQDAIGTVLGLEPLLWKTALWTYQGRLPVGTSIKERMYLRRWPNLTRLLEVPDAMRIAALMVEQPLALPRIAEALSIPQRHVFTFYAAAQATGLASQAKREADHLVAAIPSRQHAERGFIRRVVGHLKRLVA